MSRTENSIRNIRYALAGQLLGVIISFGARMVFVRTLSAEYLGINGLFSNILTMLSIAELGVGSAIVFSMYEPLAQSDEPRLRALMGLYRRAYVTIGLVVAGVGALLTPLLPFLILEMPEIPHIQLIYLMFVVNSAITYFFSYKRSFLIADQKRYITTIYRYTLFAVLNIVQILLLITTANYLLFLAAQIVFTLLENIAVSRRVDRMYPFLRVKPVPPLGPDDRATITRNIKALVLHRLGGAVLVGTDSIVISKFVGIVAVGLYSNYLLITNALSVVLGVVFSSLTASVGNLSALESRERQIGTFKAIDLAVYLCYSFATISLFVLFNPFIELWLGSEFLFDWPIVLAIAVNFYLTGVRNSLWIFKDAKGIFWPDRYRPLAEVVVNLVLSVVLAQHYGMLGVLAGTALSTLLVCLPIEPYVLYKHGFAGSPRGYYARYLLRGITALGLGALTWAIASILPWSGFVGFAAMATTCLLVPNAANILFFARSTEFQRLLTMLRRR